MTDAQRAHLARLTVIEAWLTHGRERMLKAIESGDTRPIVIEPLTPHQLQRAIHDEIEPVKLRVHA